MLITDATDQLRRRVAQAAATTHAARIVRASEPFDDSDAPAHPIVFVGGSAGAAFDAVADLFGAHPETVQVGSLDLAEAIVAPIEDHGRGSVSAWIEVLGTNAVAQSRDAAGIHRAVDDDTFAALCATAAKRPGWTDRGAIDWLIGRVLWGWYVDRARDQSPPPTLVEATPSNVAIAPLLLDAFPAAHFVEVLHDPREPVAGSARPAVTAAQWSTAVRAGAAVRALGRFHGRVHTIRSEALAGAHHDGANACFQSLGLATVGLDPAPKETGVEPTPLSDAATAALAGITADAWSASGYARP